MSGLFVDNEGKYNWKKVLYHTRSAFAVLLSLAVLVGGGWATYHYANKAYIAYRTTDDYLGSAGVQDVMVTVPRGAGMNQIGFILLDAGVIKSMKPWRKVTAAEAGSKDIQAGRYKLRTQISAEAAFNYLADPKNIERTRVTLPEGLRLTEQWPIIEKATKIKPADMKAAEQNTKALGAPAWVPAKNAEGIMFPETYEVDDSPTAAELGSAQVRQFNTVITDLNFADRAKAIGVTPYNALIVASIAEKEVRGEKDLGLVAGIFYNRLKAGMPLQSDATVVYANNIKGRLTTTNKERAVKSPYNTYVNKGLPPGPVSNPGKLALTAAVNPTKTDFLYFVVVNPDTGETAFAKTLADHNKNVKKFQAWCQSNPGKC
ncbi:Endolytic murein transglycosylase [Aestuariimicrobium sp. T2.26MG-19.2B]|nr:endolytic transglycosylase MltG [Aestuariimicrobium sp. T2.26MG-19.2B]CAI9410019.1 Endolytic murein transglycosylase [Aestuariimicrobium sp. T2.26MG-19.2B]